MLFNSPEYLVFLLLCLAVYWLLRHRAQNILLLIASYAFYSFWDYRFLTLIIVSTAVDFWAGHAIHAARERGERRLMKRALHVSLVSNLSILGFFKYFGFFVDSAVSALAAGGLEIARPGLEIVLPVGISFYTFQSLSYTLDIYRGRLRPVARPLDFALFVAYFPQLVAGPIERAQTLLPQVCNPRRVTPRQIEEGLWLIVLGLYRKVAIADTAAPMVDRVFSRPGQHSSLELMASLGLYAIQIYCDFTGYSNIARGSAKLFGFELMRNFHHPYFAASPRDFWRRWHISLSTWLRDYLYISLGGNRRGPLRTHANLMTTMLLGGLWHGASWNFVLWGALHGAYLVVSRLFADLLGERFAAQKGSIRFAGRWAGALLTFVLVCFTWLFFRSTSTATTAAFLAGIAAGTGFASWHGVLPFLGLAGMTLLVDVPQAAREDEFVFLRWPLLLRAAFAGLLIAASLFGGAASTPFIYFQF